MYPYAKHFMEMKKTTLDKVLAKHITKVSAATLLQITRPTLDKWLARYSRFGEEGLIPPERKKRTTASNRTSQEVEEIVITLALQLFTEGTESLADALYAEHHITLHPVTIWRILKRKNIRYGEWHPRTRLRWKIQLYAHTIPGQELQMDTVYPYGYKQGKVIYTIIDDATRWVHTKLYSAANAENTVSFLKEVQQRAPFHIQKIRTDQGSEFIARIVTTYLKASDIEHRRNTPYCPEENGKIERFHRTLKEKGLRYGATVNSSLEALSYRIRLFTQWYNYTKRHRGLGMRGKTPMGRLRELGCGYVN
jgi:transposase InsO family protein